ncbi:MAG: SDR family oxidoreductase [Dehalococcoidia bacterium]
MASRFEGKVVVITGAAGGIGRAAAQRFASEGANVVLVDLPGTDLAESVSTVESAGSEAHAVEADVTQAADVARYVEEARERFGGIDCFFNNAGIMGFAGDFLDYPEEIFDRVLNVNVKGVWLGLRAVVPAMRERGGGAIVNTASIAGLGGAPTLFAYGASKHAVVGMTKSAALALSADGVRVNAVCPGVIDTAMAREMERSFSPDHPDAVRQGIEQGNPMRRYGSPEEVAALVAFLCSDDASFITGGIYPIDGGGRAS